MGSLEGSWLVAGTWMGRFALLALMAVATPPPTRAPTAKQAAWRMEELGMVETAG